jgi:RNA recognition motif-containing protein
MTNIFVAKLDYGVTQEDLQSLFEQFGKVNKVSLAMDKETGKSKGFAFIEMDDEASAQEAIKQLDNTNLKGREIAVKQAEDRSASKGGSRERGSERDNRLEKPRRDFNSESKPFERKPRITTEKDDDDESSVSKPSFKPTETENIKGEVRKKEAPKKKENSKNISDGNQRQQKMPAYKKSGKKDRYFDIEDEDDY